MSCRKRSILGGIVVLLVFVFVGCASPPERVISTEPAVYAGLPDGYDPLNPERIAPTYASLTGIDQSLYRNLERKQGRALNILSLSGGGQNGAFGAGFLIGWRESGKRPDFDIVSGVSTGALMATHALLGTPADDVVLEALYTQVSKKDIYREKGIFSILSGTDSLMDTTPLKSLIAKHITAETLERVAVAYEDNRLIVVGTTNIDYSQTWLWNMSAIAKDGKLELYRKVLLASASFPILFPPVEIDGHLFIDGAARINVVVAGLTGAVRPAPPLYGPGNIYLFNNGKLRYPPEALRRVLGDVAATTVTVMMDQSMQTALRRSYFGAKILGYNFHMVSIPDDVTIGKDPLAFDPEQMRAAFDAGRALAKQPKPWSTAPPSGDIPTWALEALSE